MERELTTMHNRMTSWTPADNDELRFALKSFNIPVDEHRWPYTYATDFYRSHGPGHDWNRSEASVALQRVANEQGVSLQYLYGLFALAYMAGTGLNPDFAVLVAIANSPVLREPFELLRASSLRFPTFWLPIDEEAGI
jgi:hypothetical protein